jgi:hypothetical protein
MNNCVFMFVFSHAGVFDADSTCQLLSRAIRQSIFLDFGCVFFYPLLVTLNIVKCPKGGLKF